MVKLHVKPPPQVGPGTKGEGSDQLSAGDQDAASKPKSCGGIRVGCYSAAYCRVPRQPYLLGSGGRVPDN